MADKYGYKSWDTLRDAMKRLCVDIPPMRADEKDRSKYWQLHGDRHGSTMGAASRYGGYKLGSGKGGRKVEKLQKMLKPLLGWAADCMSKWMKEEK